MQLYMVWNFVWRMFEVQDRRSWTRGRIVFYRWRIVKLEGEIVFSFWWGLGFCCWRKCHHLGHHLLLLLHLLCLLVVDVIEMTTQMKMYITLWFLCRNWERKMMPSRQISKGRIYDLELLWYWSFEATSLYSMVAVGLIIIIGWWRWIGDGQ